MNRIKYILAMALLLLMGAATPSFAQTIKGNVYGGGNLAQVEGSTTININSGDISAEGNSENGNVYGGGLGASAVLTGNTTVNVSGGTVAKDVYGGGALANVTGSTEVNVRGGTVTQDVYGGGALANVVKDLEHELLGNTTVNLTGGTIRNSYGGGLGQLADAGAGKDSVAAIVNGDATVQLGSDDGTTSSKVLGSIFGANNVNGTPEGHVLVHVLKTTSRDQANRNTTGTAESFDVMSVYGGGNLAAYVPSAATLANAEKNFAEVLIENCDNSIAYVYGGGNAAPVPATKVTIKGANAIDNAFAGGNGAGQSTDPSAANYNPGADIGYLEYTRNNPAKEYGTGIATIEVKGGTIHHVYGGSNTLGYIKDHAVVNVESEGTCTMDVAELYGGGKKAPGKAATINITCTGESGKIDDVYGGAHMADLTGDITLNIYGGNIGNAFGGNNESGTINGKITVNVDWSGSCGNNNYIGNVYGGGNLAPYYAYGYDVVDGVWTEKTVDQDAPIVYGPIVNIRNGIVGNVFGGGKGKAVSDDPGDDDPDIPWGQITGNPQVKIGSSIDGEVVHDDVSGHQVTIENSVYGGGDAAPVVGNTRVIVDGSGMDGDCQGIYSNSTPKGVFVKGYVFGGGYGETAVIKKTGTNDDDSGNTHVELVDKVTVMLNVYGGGNGGAVEGDTEVVIGQ